MMMMATTAILYGLTLRFDYWSNAVEFLGVCLVLSSGVLGWHPLAYLGIGLVLALGRETTILLALLGTPAALCFGAGAAIGHGAVRLLSRPAEEWLEAEESMGYGKPMWRTNLAFFYSDPASLAECAIYLGIAALSFSIAPWLTLALVALTFLVARIDEPRVLTMLTPLAAMGVIRWLS